jgi:hypothetical protein
MVAVFILFQGFHSLGATAQTIVSTLVESGIPSATGTSFVVAVEVSRNTILLVGYSLRVTFDASNANFLSTDDGEFGAPPNDTPGASGNQRDLGQFKPNATFTNGILCRIVFQTGNSLTFPYSISLSDDPDHPTSLLGNDFVTSVAHSFNNQATLDISHILVEDPRPEAPIGVVASPGATSVLLEWEPNIEFNLARYDVYASAAPTVPLPASNRVPDSGLVIPIRDVPPEVFFITSFKRSTRREEKACRVTR